MTFEQYVPDGTAYGFMNGFIWMMILGFAPAIIALLLGLLFWRKQAIQGAAWTLVAGAMLGAFAGFIFSVDVGRMENNKILQHNIMEKYDARIVKMGMTNQGRSSEPYPASNKTTHEVTIKVNGETKLAYLKQDQDTNEPTLLNYDTKQPLTDILKEK